MNKQINNLKEQKGDYQMKDENLKTIKEVAEIMGISASTLRRWKTMGLIKPAGRRGLRTLYFDINEVRKLEEVDYEIDRN